jgi:hypothetical protein
MESDDDENDDFYEENDDTQSHVYMIHECRPVLDSIKNVAINDIREMPDPIDLDELENSLKIPIDADADADQNETVKGLILEWIAVETKKDDIIRNLRPIFAKMEK